MNIFVSGTGTGVGKTVITAGIAAFIRNLGYSVGVFKPIETGSSVIDNKYVSSDLAFVKSIDSTILTKISYNFKVPAAPLVAAFSEGVDIDCEKIIEDYNELKKKCDFVLVEGAGGMLVPIKDNFFMADLCKVLDLPLLIVAKPDLGTINHTLLSIESAKSRKIEISGIIISNYPEKTEEISIKTAADIIQNFSGEKILGILPKIENLRNNPDILKEMISTYINMDFITKKRPESL